MNTVQRLGRFKCLTTTAATVILLAVGSTVAWSDETMVKLSGDQEVPPVKTTAAGTGRITVNPDMTVTGKVTTTGAVGTMAHIHQGATGKNGPPVVTLKKEGDNDWSVPPGTKFTDAEYKAFKAGELYFNVHSPDNKGGELRGQIKP